MYYVLYIGRDSKLKDLRTTLAKEKIKGSFRVKKLRKKHVYNYDQTLKLVRDYRYIYDFVIIDTGSLDYFTVADLIRGLYYLTSLSCEGPTILDKDLKLYKTKD